MKKIIMVWVMGVAALLSGCSDPIPESKKETSWGTPPTNMTEEQIKEAEEFNKFIKTPPKINRNDNKEF